MRLLAFSDLHCQVAAAKRLVTLADEADVVIGAGDFANARRGLAATLDILRTIQKPLVFVPGNSESAEELAHAIPQAHTLHGTGVVIDGVQFFGIGGGIPVTPFGAWSYDFTEAEATALLADCPLPCDVLISHSPPQGAVDLSSRGRNLGSVAIREAVLRIRPKFTFCGHIHNSAGQQTQLGTTTVVNAGPQGILLQL